MGSIDDFERHLDEHIPDDVLNSDSWDTRLLPDLTRLTDPNRFFGDMVGSSEVDGDGLDDYEEDYDDYE